PAPKPASSPSASVWQVLPAPAAAATPSPAPKLASSSDAWAAGSSPSPRPGAPARVAAPAAPSELVEINLVAGQKNLDSSDWQPVDQQLAVGAQATWTPPHWPIGIATDFLYSSASEKQNLLDASNTLVPVQLRGSTMEAALGARKIFDLDAFHPYLGAGVILTNASAYAK